MQIATKRRIFIAAIIALIVTGVFLVWYFSALTHYHLSLNKRYSYHLTYRSTVKTTVIFPKVEAQTNSGETNCEMKWDLVPLRLVDDIYTILALPAPAGDCRFLFNGKDLLDDAAFRERVFTDKYTVVRMDARGA